jgi:hypothetical protein
LAIDNGLLGWVDTHAQLAFPRAEIPKAFGFSNGLARFQMDGLYGYLDRSGKMAIPNQYEDAADFTHGLARVFANGGLAYIDTKGNVVWPAAKP